MPTVSKWTEAPEIGIPEQPAFLYADNVMFLSYETSEKDKYSIVRFEGVIDHRLSPINDEGLGEHEFAGFGLDWYSFHEVTDSEHTRKWSALGARLWVITFKDSTLDVLAATATVLTKNLSGSSACDALLKHTGSNGTKC